MNREQYEDLYRKLWIKQLIEDKEKNKQLQIKLGLNDNLPDEGQEGVFKKPLPRKLTDKAAVINRMIVKGMTMREIGEILGISHQAVTQVKLRYGLPRNAENEPNQ